MRCFICKFCYFLTLIVISGCFFNNNSQKWILDKEGSTSFSLSRNGRFALVSSNAKGINLWDLFEYKILADFGYQDPEKSAVIASKISDNNRYAITATSQNFAVWDLAYGKSEGLWSISDGIIQDVAISNNGQKTILALSNNKALFIDLGTGRRLEFLAHKAKVNTVAISPNGRFVLSGGNDHNAYFWDTDTGQISQIFSHKDRITRVALHREAKYGFSSDINDLAQIWNLATGEKISELQTFHRNSNYSVARFSDDAKYLITGTPSRRVELWDSLTGKNIKRWLADEETNARPPSAVVYDVAMDKTGRIIAGTSAGMAQAWITHLEKASNDN